MYKMNETFIVLIYVFPKHEFDVLLSHSSLMNPFVCIVQECAMFVCIVMELYKHGHFSLV